MFTRNLEDIEEVRGRFCRNLRMMELTEEFLLVHNRIDTAFGDDAGLGHLFHGEQLLFFLQVDSPDLAETASADDVLEVEVILVDFYEQTKLKCAH